MAFTFTLFFAATALSQSIFDFQTKTIGGRSLPLSDYKGKVILVVNIATQCGYTGQLGGLEELYKKHKKQGLVILGIPSNDFGGQTPEGNKDVKKFCRINYGVSFPLAAKTNLTGPKKPKMIQFLTRQGKKTQDIGWNFEKFLLDRKGQVKKRFGSGTEPNDPQLEKAILALLNP